MMQRPYFLLIAGFETGSTHEAKSIIQGFRLTGFDDVDAIFGACILHQ